MAKSALLLLDIQNSITSRLPGASSYLASLSVTVRRARDASIQIIHVTTAFRQGYSDLHPRNPSSSRITKSGSYIEGSDSTKIHSTVSCSPSDIKIVKKRVSAFCGTDLSLVLRSLGAESLVIAGVVTSGAVLSTVRCAADLDYELTVLEDLCADYDLEVHRTLMEKVFPRQAAVKGSEEWLDSLSDVKGHS